MDLERSCFDYDNHPCSLLMDHQAIYRLFSPWGILMRPWPSGQAKWLQGGNEALNKCAPDGSGARVIRRST